MDRPYIPASGNQHAKLMVLCESPSHDDLMNSRILSGSSGREFDKILSELNLNRDDFWISYVCKHPVRANAKGKRIPFAKRAEIDLVDIGEQIRDLQVEINTIKPNAILALGSTALWALTGKTNIKDMRGSILQSGMGPKVIPTYNPRDLSWQTEGAEFKGYWNREVIKFDFKRAYDQSFFADIRRPNRHLSICRSSSQLADFIERNRNRSRPAADIEARGSCLPFCIGFSFTPTEGITIPFWNRGEIESVVKIPDSDMVSMWILISQILMNNDIVGQNFKYDQDKIRRIGFGIRSLASDTMLKAFAINPEFPKALAFNQSIYTEEPFYKDEGMYEGKLEDLLIGCARDACVTKEIDLGMDTDLDHLDGRPYYEHFILHLHSLYLGIENEGFYIDSNKRDDLFDKYIRWSERLSHELFTIVGDYVNVNSPKQVATLLYEVWKLPPRYGTGEEEITALLNMQTLKLTDDKRRGLELILEKRRVEKTIGTYLMAFPDYDGKMKTTYYLCLETGRTSTSQLEPPIRPDFEIESEHQLTGKKKKNTKVIGTAFQTITKHGDIGQDIRSQYVPAPGHVFIQADSAQAEARVVFLLANDFEALKLIDTHDYHAMTTSWFFGGTEDDYSKKTLGYESPHRFVGKTLRHAGHLGAGKRRAATTVNTDARKFKIPITITEAVADRALKIFHSRQPKIQQVFHAGIQEALAKQNRFLVAGLPYGIDSRIGGKRQFFERWGDELFRMAFSYIPQRSVSDNTKACALRLKKREPSLRIVLEAHDGLLFMIPESEVDYFCPMIKEEMERPIRFETCSMSRPDLIIPCELEKGYNYMELSKFKFHVPVEVREKMAPEEVEVRELSVTEQFLVTE